VIIGFGTYQMFKVPADITGAGAAAYSTLMLLPALTAGLIKWRLGSAD